MGRALWAPAELADLHSPQNAALCPGTPSQPAARHRFPSSFYLCVWGWKTLWVTRCLAGDRHSSSPKTVVGPTLPEAQLPGEPLGGAHHPPLQRVSGRGVLTSFRDPRSMASFPHYPVVLLLSPLSSQDLAYNRFFVNVCGLDKPPTHHRESF